MVPRGCCSIQAEISESVYRIRNRATLVQETLEGLVRLGILGKKDATNVSKGGRVYVTKVMTLNPAYVIYDLNHRENTRRIKDYLRTLNIEARGRFGGWEYLNMDHAILNGKEAVEAAVGKRCITEGYA